MKCIIYCRKSSESEEKQVQSIESQKIELTKLAKLHGLEIDKIFEEEKSAKLPGRLVFAEMIEYINKNQPVIIIVWKIDRLSRNPIDEGQIKFLLQQSAISKIITPFSTYLPGDNVLMAAFEFGMANQYIRDLSNNVKRGNKTKLEKGQWPGPAPFGYLNDKINKTVYPDPDRIAYVLKAFNMYASGSYSTIEIANELYSQGLRTKAGYKLGKSLVYRMLTNPFYVGLMFRAGNLYKGSHKPIVSQELFDQVQAVLNSNQHPRKQKHFFSLRGMVLCASCGCMLTVSRKKGFVYYYCTNAKHNCQEHFKYLKEEKLHPQVAGVFDLFNFDEELVEVMYEAKKEKLAKNPEHKQNVITTLEQNLKNTLEKQSKLLDSYLSEATPESVYTPKIKALKQEELILSNQLEQVEKKKVLNPEVTLEQTKDIFLTAIKAKKEYLDADEYKRHNILEKLLWNAKISGQKIQDYQLKRPYQLLAVGPQKRDLDFWLPLVDKFRTANWANIKRDLQFSGILELFNKTNTLELRPSLPQY
jgi:DNA invertase Pin-like site-specific DNA recombinase